MIGHDEDSAIAIIVQVDDDSALSGLAWFGKTALKSASEEREGIRWLGVHWGEVGWGCRGASGTAV